MPWDARLKAPTARVRGRVQEHPRQRVACTVRRSDPSGRLYGQMNLGQRSAVVLCPDRHALPVGDPYSLAALAPLGDADGFASLFRPHKNAVPKCLGPFPLPQLPPAGQWKTS